MKQNLKTSCIQKIRVTYLDQQKFLHDTVINEAWTFEVILPELT